MRRILIFALVVTAATGVVLALIGPTTLKRWAYEEPGRDEWQQPERVIATLAIESGDRIADIGSGGGYFAFRLAQAAGDSGRVWACDLDAGLNEYVREEAESRGLSNLTVVEADLDDPRFPEPVDLIFTSNTVHHLDDPGSYFGRLRDRLRPLGRIAIVDYREPHMEALAKPELIAAIELHGYELIAEHDFLEKQFFLIFAPTP